MAFKVSRTGSGAAESPEALFRDIRTRKIPGLLAHQADVLRQYVDQALDKADVALQLPTGSGKTLVGLLIAEWRRRKFGDLCVYLCPTNQLVYQVADQANAKYGLKVNAFVGKKAEYASEAKSEYLNGEAVAITSYSGLFNTYPFFENPSSIILDDAHSAENYISAMWSLRLERYRDDQQAMFYALVNILRGVLTPIELQRLTGKEQSHFDRGWIEKIPTPHFVPLIPEIAAAFEAGVGTSDLSWRWRLLKDHLDACHMYVSQSELLIRPLLPPTFSHRPFSDAKHRIYMSATLGAGGELERVSGRRNIHRIKAPAGWDKQGGGRRLFFFPGRSLKEEESMRLSWAMMRVAGRSLALVPDTTSELFAYLMQKGRREFLHPELQAELEFGIEQSKEVSAVEHIDNLKLFLAQGKEWQQADEAILQIREAKTQVALPGTEDLAKSAAAEIDYQEALWSRDFERAIDACRSVIGNFSHKDLRGYRALWGYFAGSAAWLADRGKRGRFDGISRQFYREAKAAAPTVSWLAGLVARDDESSPQDVENARTMALVERLENVLEELGVVHDRRFSAAEKEILENLQNSESDRFEYGHERLGRILGFEAGNRKSVGSPDPGWSVNENMCFVFEDYSDAKIDAVLDIKKARQVSTHPNWVRANLPLKKGADVIPVLVSPISRISPDAMPHVKDVLLWNIEDFRAWARNGLAVVREIRRSFPGSGDLAWRAEAARRLYECHVAPDSLLKYLDDLPKAKSYPAG